MVVTLPAAFIHDGDTQNIFFFLSLSTAQTVPVTIAVGSVGGTNVVIKLRPLSISSQLETSLIYMNLWNHAPHRITEQMKQKRMK